MKKSLLLIPLVVSALFWLSGMDIGGLRRAALAANQPAARSGHHAGVHPAAAPGGVADEAAALEAKREQLAEKEAALKVKEEELKKMSARLDSRINELNSARKAMEGSLQTRKKQENERYKKILKIYKGLKPDEAGRLMDKLDEATVIEMLNQMDQKTAVKLIPYLSQPRVLAWTKENLAGR